MTRLGIVMGFLAKVLLVSVIVAMTAALVPASAFSDAKVRFLFGFLASLLVAGVTGGVACFLSRYSERPLIKIEHVNFKSERVAYKLPADLWWWVLQNKDFLQHVEKHVPWPMERFHKNEFRYHTLQGLRECVEAFFEKYSSAAEWALEFLQLMAALKVERDDAKKNAFLDSMTYFLGRFEDQYRQVFHSDIHSDLRKKTGQIISFLEPEVNGLLSVHRMEIATLERINAWCLACLSQGEGAPKDIDYQKKLVPSPVILVGASNIGGTSGQLKFKGRLKHNGAEMPIRLKSPDSNYFVDLQPNDARPLVFVFNSDESSFDKQETWYGKLVKATTQARVTVELELADGTKVVKRKVPLVDDKTLAL